MVMMRKTFAGKKILMNDIQVIIPEQPTNKKSRLQVQKI